MERRDSDRGTSIFEGPESRKHVDSRTKSSEVRLKLRGGKIAGGREASGPEGATVGNRQGRARGADGGTNQDE